MPYTFANANGERQKFAKVLMNPNSNTETILVDICTQAQFVYWCDGILLKKKTETKIISLVDVAFGSNIV